MDDPTKVKIRFKGSQELDVDVADLVRTLMESSHDNKVDLDLTFDSPADPILQEKLVAAVSEVLAEPSPSNPAPALNDDDDHNLEWLGKVAEIDRLWKKIDKAKAAKAAARMKMLRRYCGPIGNIVVRFFTGSYIGK